MAASTEHLCSELAKLGVKITVITTRISGRFGANGNRQSEDDEESEFETIRLPVAGRRWERFTGIYYTPGFRETYGRFATAVDLVHFHGFRSYQNFSAARVMHKTRVKYILQPHGSSVRGYGKGLMKGVYDKLIGTKQALHADALIASTQLEATGLRSLGIDSKRIHIVPNGVYKEIWAAHPTARTTLRDRFKIPQNAPIVLFVGRLDLTKGLGFLIQSFGDAVKQAPDARLVLLGPDFGVRSQLKTDVRKSGLDDHVIFAGLADQDTVRSAYKESMVVVVPSTYESFSLVALEAAAAGTPVLMTDRCGLADTFRDAGVTIARADIRSMANAILRLLQDEALRKSQQNALDRLPWETFSWRGVAHAVLKVYEDVLES